MDEDNPINAVAKYTVITGLTRNLAYPQDTESNSA